MNAVSQRALIVLAGGVDNWWELPIGPGCIDLRQYRFDVLGER